MEKKYLTWDEKTVTDFSSYNIETMYGDGFVFTRLAKGVMQQTRSIRISLEKFEPSSENRRILKKNADLSVEAHPLPYKDYDWSIGKMAKDFYDRRSAQFSANKVKEILTDPAKSNFNMLLVFKKGKQTVGYAICNETDNTIHYSYPFHTDADKDLGLGMMLLAIEHAQKKGKRFFYIGSLQRASDTYKLQFAGIEWFDGKTWLQNTDIAKGILRNK